MLDLSRQCNKFITEKDLDIRENDLLQLDVCQNLKNVQLDHSLPTHLSGLRDTSFVQNKYV